MSSLLDRQAQHPAGPSPGSAATAEQAADPVEQPDAEQADPAAGGAGPERDLRPVLAAAELRRDFGTHLEANYQRLVAQLYVITLDAGEAHEAVQDAYSRAWRRWPQLRHDPDPVGWVRRVAVRSTRGSWRRLLAALGVGSRAHRVNDEADDRTRAVLEALARLTPPQRRVVVLSHMAGMPVEEISALEAIPSWAVQRRLDEAEEVVATGMADVLPEILGLIDEARYR